MYADNQFGRRRPEGWADRRRYFKKILSRVRQEPQAAAEDKEKNPAPSK